MNLWQLLEVFALVTAVSVVALFVYGTFLLGRGTEAEAEARERFDGSVGASAWAGVDALQALSFYAGRFVDAALGSIGIHRRESTATYRCPNCRHVFQDESSRWPSCPNCGDESPVIIAS